MPSLLKDYLLIVTIIALWTIAVLPIGWALGVAIGPIRWGVLAFFLFVWAPLIAFGLTHLVDRVLDQ